MFRENEELKKEINIFKTLLEREKTITSKWTNSYQIMVRKWKEDESISDLRKDLRTTFVPTSDQLVDEQTRLFRKY